MSKYVDAPQFNYQQEPVKKDPLAAYKLPFKTKGKAKLDASQKTETVPEKQRPVYSLELIFSL